LASPYICVADRSTIIRRLGNADIRAVVTEPNQQAKAGDASASN